MPKRNKYKKTEIKKRLTRSLSPESQDYFVTIHVRAMLGKIMISFLKFKEAVHDFVWYFLVEI